MTIQAFNQISSQSKSKVFIKANNFTLPSYLYSNSKRKAQLKTSALLNSISNYEIRALTTGLFDANKWTPLTYSKENVISTIIAIFCNALGIPGIDNVSADEEVSVHSELTNATNIEEIMEERHEENDNGEDSSVISRVKNPKI
eukprot:12306292-Ditylum_brightwellii.AAC.1